MTMRVRRRALEAAATCSHPASMERPVTAEETLGRQGAPACCPRLRQVGRRGHRDASTAAAATKRLHQGRPARRRRYRDSGNRATIVPTVVKPQQVAAQEGEARSG